MSNIIFIQSLHSARLQRPSNSSSCWIIKLWIWENLIKNSWNFMKLQMSPRWFFGAFFGHASLAYFFLVVFDSISKSIGSCSCNCGVLNWTCIVIGLLETSISGAGLGRAGMSVDEYKPKDSSWCSPTGSLEVEGRPAYKLGAEMIGWWRICFCSTCGVEGKVKELDDPSSRMRLLLIGTMVDCKRFLNFPIESSMSSGFMIISSSLKWTRFRFAPFLATNESVMPSVEILRLWAVLYSVRF